jgi:hypothetical protein
MASWRVKSFGGPTVAFSVGGISRKTASASA